MPEKTDGAAKAPKETESGARVALDHEAALEVGFFGVEVDPTPDEHYSVTGVIEGKPTPETDEKAAAAAKEAAQ